MSKRPDVNEYAAFYQPYLDRVPDGDIVATLRRQLAETTTLLQDVSPERQRSTYAAGKWTLNEVFGHVLDMEWVFTSRALMFARADGVTMPGADQLEFSRNARSTEQSLDALLEQFRCVRSAAVLLFESFEESVWDRSGIASGNPFTVRALAWIIAGHERHHRIVIAERYLRVPAP